MLADARRRRFDCVLCTKLDRLARSVRHLTTLGEELGRYAFRTRSFPQTAKGKFTVMARASTAIGQTQTSELILNPAGYHHNLIQSITLTVA